MKHLKKVAIAVLGLSLACMPVLASCDNNNTDQVDPVEAKLESIAITKMPTKVNYETGDIFDPTGMEVTAKYDNGKTEVVTDYSYSKNPLSETDTKVIISYKGKTAEVPITVKFVLKITGISVEVKPNKTKYVVGETFDPTGMKVVALHNNNTKNVITDYTIDKTGPLTLDDKFVTITYQEFNTTVSITVEEEKIAGIVINKLPTKAAYVKGETFDPTGIEVSTITNNGKLTPVDSKDLTFEGVDGPLNTLGNVEIIVMYQEIMSASFKVYVSESRLTGISVSRLPNIRSYVTGQRFDTVGMQITATYEDGSTALIGNDLYAVDKTDPLTLEDTEVTISLGGFEAKVTITITEALTTVNIDSLGTIRIEGEHMDTTKASMRQDFINAGRTFIENGIDASNGQNICGYNPGSVFEIPIATEKKAKVSIVARMSHSDANYDITKGFKFNVGDQVLTPQDAKFIYHGGQDYWNWIQFLVGEVELEPGEHTFKMEVLNGHPNIDCFDFIVTEYDDQVANKEVMTMNLLSGPTKTKYEIGEKFDPTGIKLEVKYTDYTKEIVTDYTIDKTEELTITDEYVTLSYLGAEVQIPIVVGKEYGFKILDVGAKRFEAEKLNLENAAGASLSGDGKYVDFAVGGDTMSFTLYSHKASTVKLFAGFKTELDTPVNEMITFKLNDETLTADKSNVQVGTWVELSLGEVELKEAGEYTFTIETLSGGIALDYIEFFTAKYGDKTAPHNLESIYVKENPTKMSYIETETFDPTGMKVYGKYSDRTEGEIKDFTVDKTGPLTTEDTTITVTADDLTCTLNIKVYAINLRVEEAKQYRVEAESLDLSNIIHDGNPNHYENSPDFSSGGINVGHILSGYFSVYFTTNEKMTLNALLKIAHPNGNKLGEKVTSITIDGTEVTYDKEIILDSAPGNQYWNYKDVALPCGELEAGLHELRFNFNNGAGNIDCIDLTFTK